MTVLVAGIFRDLDVASAAVERLREAGVPAVDISLVTPDNRSRVEPPTTTRDATSGGVATGAVVGGLGGLLAGLAALTIPGLGPVLVLGPIAGAIGGAAVGAAAGGLVGGLVNLGLPEDFANRYQADLEAGGVLVVVRPPRAHQEAVEEIMRHTGAANLYTARTASPA